MQLQHRPPRRTTPSPSKGDRRETLESHRQNGIPPYAVLSSSATSTPVYKTSKPRRTKRELRVLEHMPHQDTWAQPPPIDPFFEASSPDEFSDQDREYEWGEGQFKRPRISTDWSSGEEGDDGYYENTHDELEERYVMVGPDDVL